MKRVDLYGRVRHAVMVQGMSRREAARIFGIDRRTVDKMLVFSVPPGYRRKQAPARPKSSHPMCSMYQSAASCGFGADRCTW